MPRVGAQWSRARSGDRVTCTDAYCDHADYRVDESPLRVVNTWAPLLLPLIAAAMGLLFVGVMRLTLHRAATGDAWTRSGALATSGTVATTFRNASRFRAARKLVDRARQNK